MWQKIKVVCFWLTVYIIDVQKVECEYNGTICLSVFN